MAILRWLKSIFRRQGFDADYLYADLVRRARQPIFYSDWQVPDTLEGRFDMVLLHLGLLLPQLGARGDFELVREVQEAFIREMDRMLREEGVGDMSVGKQVKNLSAAMLGRQDVYASALGVTLNGQAAEGAEGAEVSDNGTAKAANKIDADRLLEAIKRNVYRLEKDDDVDSASSSTDVTPGKDVVDALLTYALDFALDVEQTPTATLIERARSAY